jgi:prepilin-type N-terminal cleavage/methylation domain-containing protein
MRDRGFSLLEVLVAVTIIGLGFSVLFAGMSGSLSNLQRVQVTDHRVELARQKLAELDLLKKIRPSDSASGQFEDGTRWTIQTSPFIASVKEGPRVNPASIIRVDLVLQWSGRTEVQKQVIQTYRYQLEDGKPIPSLDEQLHEIQ